MFEYPDFIANILGIAAIGLGIFSFVVMVVVFQASLAAKDYFERENREHRVRSAQRITRAS